MKKGCFLRITVPYEGVDFWEVFLSFVKNGVSAYAAEDIFNIKFKENFVVVGLVHEVAGGVDYSFTPHGGVYPYLGGQEFTEPWNEGFQADFSDKTSVGASYSNGSEAVAKLAHWARGVKSLL